MNIRSAEPFLDAGFSITCVLLVLIIAGIALDMRTSLDLAPKLFGSMFDEPTDGCEDEDGCAERDSPGGILDGAENDPELDCDAEDGNEATHGEDG